MLDYGKASLRRRLRQLRNELPEGERDACDADIFQRIVSLDAYRSAPLIFTYLSFEAEIDTRRLIARAWEDGKVVALPRCESKAHRMHLHRITSLAHLVPTRFGLKEPDPERTKEICAEDLGTDVLAIVPALAFDHNGMRLGYGGGYYDRFLAGFPGITVGPCREQFLVDDLAALGALEPHDQGVQIIVTEIRTMAPCHPRTTGDESVRRYLGNVHCGRSERHTPAGRIEGETIS